MLVVGQIKPAQKTKGSDNNRTTKVANSFRGISKPITIPKKITDNKKGIVNLNKSTILAFLLIP